LDERGYGCAALLVDTIFSSDGVFADPPGFLAQAVARVQARGGLFIADEVQPGFGRTGSHFWGFQRHSVQ
ncbi:aminotransferase class III-fold pyridoxal phosphate-dependent enzyme, partial [Klebsiella pneumoniae]